MAETALYDLPWLDYEGQTVDQILACASTHRVDSLLVALVEAIEARPSGRITPVERVLLSIEALQNEVNNGGFQQFFSNSSCQYAPVVVASLLEVGLDEAAIITQRAINLLCVDEVTAESVSAAADRATDGDDERVLGGLEACDEQYFQIADIDEKLFAFVQRRAAELGR